ncbi:hypothetical protein Tco_0250947 [Tanacetum coccineum]
MVPRTVLTKSGPISLNTARPINNVQSRTTVNNGTRVNTARPKAVLSAVKASACWVWRTKHKVLDHVYRNIVHQCPLKDLTILMHKADPNNDEDVGAEADINNLDVFISRKLALRFMRPFGCPVIILNTIDHLGKFDGKADEGFFIGYYTNSKAFRVFNSRS